MDSKKVLNMTTIFFKIMLVLASVLFLIHLFVFTHSLIYPDKYNKLLIKPNQIGFDFNYRVNLEEYPNTFEEWEEQKKNLDGYFFYNKLTVNKKLFALLKHALSVAICFYILHYILAFCKSVKNYSTFFTNNSIYFKKMGYCFLIALAINFLLSILGNEIEMIFPENQVVASTIYVFNLGPVITLLGAYIICILASNVFKEGEKLRIENELTI